MPVYLTSTKEKDDHRLIKAISQKAAEDFFLGKHQLECRTITDAAEGAELGAKYQLENADAPAVAAAPDPAPAPKANPAAGKDAGNAEKE